MMKFSHLPYLDGWRGIAILLVLGGHFFKLPAQRLGVEVFFVLSGLLMSRLLYQSRTPLGLFYQRRIARIFPAYFLFLGVVAIGACVLLPTFPHAQFFYNALFLQQYMPEGTYFNGSVPVGHLWSLNVEEHSYIFLSLIAMLTLKPRATGIVLGLSSLSCVVMYGIYYLLGINGIFRSECAAFPLLISAALNLWLKDSRYAEPLLLASALGLVASVIVSRKWGGSIAIDYVFKTFCLALMVNTLHAAPIWVHRALSSVVLRWFGICSFSLYLWQQPFYQWVKDAGLDPSVGLLAALAIGAASFYLLENPLRRAIRNWGSARAVKSAPVTQ